MKIPPRPGIPDAVRLDGEAKDHREAMQQMMLLQAVLSNHPTKKFRVVAYDPEDGTGPRIEWQVVE